MSDQDKTDPDPFAQTPSTKATKKAARKTAKKKAVDLTKLEVIVVNEDGTDTVGGFIIDKVTSKAVILKPCVVDLRTVKINGADYEVDLNWLKRQPANATHLTKPVSSLIISIELAG